MTDRFIQSSNLYNSPSFLKGIARIFDLFGQLDNYYTHRTEEEADTNAISRDWKIVGNDILNALKKYESNFRK